ncbi:MAG: SUF system NifU family Fe-S cluster assembly protein [Armatimonadota bacterium]|nr:SUF system NifU family Fe-S cluster assembly protein [Armatimonadota bacterium]
MTSDLDELYKDAILDHYRNPRGSGKLESPTHSAIGHNPLCGDEVTVEVKLDGDVIEQIGHISTGCAICVASASLMAESVTGKTIKKFKLFSDQFYNLVKGGDVHDEMGKLVVLAGVSEFPMRVKCATLAWHTLESALAGRREAKTE